MQDELKSTQQTTSMASQVDYSNIARFYTNHVQANISLFEIRLILNFVHGINSETGHLMAGDTMFVSMAPEMAQALHNILGKALEGYTRDYGSLRLPATANVKVSEHLDPESKHALDMAEALAVESHGTPTKA